MPNLKETNKNEPRGWRNECKLTPPKYLKCFTQNCSTLKQEAGLLSLLLITWVLQEFGGNHHHERVDAHAVEFLLWIRHVYWFYAVLYPLHKHLEHCHPCSSPGCYWLSWFLSSLQQHQPSLCFHFRWVTVIRFSGNGMPELLTGVWTRFALLLSKFILSQTIVLISASTASVWCRNVN